MTRLSLLYTVLGLSLALASHTTGSAQTRSGTIRGLLTDSDTKSALIGATVLIQSINRGTASGLDGRYRFEQVPVGHYSVRVSYVGYQAGIVTDVIVRTDRITTVDVDLTPVVVEAQGLTITGDYFPTASDQLSSVTGFQAEEIRRAPGSAGDVSRILFGLPSLAKVDDTRNSLVVRGGSPMENAFYIDNIEIPNINHYPTQGSSGGPIGLLNVDLIKDVRMYTGGFSAAYGDRLSAIMDISFREGNRDEVDTQVDLSLAGFGFVSEGPLPGNSGSWLVSARRSYVDLLMDLFSEELALPRYGDAQAKVVIDASAKHQITWLGVLGLDLSSILYEDAVEEPENTYGDWKTDERTVGVNWRYLWGENGYSNTSVSHSLTRFRSDVYDTGDRTLLFDNRSDEHHFGFRNVNYARFDSRHRIEFGLEGHVQYANYDNLYSESTDLVGGLKPELQVKTTATTSRLGMFATHTWRPTSRLSVQPGVRIDFSTYTDQFHLSPRFAISFDASSRTSLSASSGLYYQQLPLLLLTQNESNKELQQPVSRHVIVGLRHLLSESTRLTLETYDKQYNHFPLDPTQPGLFIVDQIFYQNGMLQNHTGLRDTGKAFTRGVELTVQKKLATRLYGLVGASYFRSRYRDFDKTWRDRTFDNRFLFNIEGGYKPGRSNEFSIRWIYAGGKPYTPFDVPASLDSGHGVFDVAKINAHRLPAYHSLNIRYDHRFHFKHSTLITYLSVWNAYARDNVAQVSWNEAKGEEEYWYQWGLLPVFGLEFEF